MTKSTEPPNAAQPSAEAVALDAGDSGTVVSKVSTEVLIAPEGSPLRRVGVKPAAPSISDAELPRSARTLASGRSDTYLGCVIDERYRVISIIGEGGMGIVYECKHNVIGKRVAMKVLRSDMARDQEVTSRFLNEARAASAIGNPHIIDISDFGQLPDGSTYFVMELLDGESLTRVIETCRPVPIPRLLHIAKQLAEGLAAAHDSGIVHRDLKPDNIFVVSRGAEKDFVKILDFGIAKVSTAEGGRLTRVGTVFGTPHYMSPEQAAGTVVDHRGDIYSFGVILYELACGRVPFDADNFMGILTQHMYKAPVPIRALSPAAQEIPPGLEAIILKCLSKRPEQRYQSMHEVLPEFEKVEAGLVPDAVAELMGRSGSFSVPSDYFRNAGVPSGPNPRRRHTKWPLIAGITGVIAAVVIVVGIFAASSAGRATTRANVSAPPEKALSSSPATASVDAKHEEPHATRQVVLATQPLDAHGFVGEQDLGPSPIVVDVQEGTTKVIEIRRTGFVTKSITLDGNEGRLSVLLDKKAIKADSKPAPPAKGAKATKPTKPGSSLSPGGEISDPWAH